MQARAAYATGYPAAALALYQSVLAADPKNVEALNVAGMILAERGSTVAQQLSALGDQYGHACAIAVAQSHTIDAKKRFSCAAKSF